MTSAKTPVVLDHEKLFEHVDQMTNVEKVELEGVTTYTGEHPDLGRVHVVMPAFGKGLVLLAALFGAIMYQIQLSFLALPFEILTLV